MTTWTCLVVATLLAGFASSGPSLSLLARDEGTAHLPLGPALAASFPPIPQAPEINSWDDLIAQYSFSLLPHSRESNSFSFASSGDLPFNAMHSAELCWDTLHLALLCSVWFQFWANSRTSSPAYINNPVHHPPSKRNISFQVSVQLDGDSDGVNIFTKILIPALFVSQQCSLSHGVFRIYTKWFSGLTCMHSLPRKARISGEALLIISAKVSKHFQGDALCYSFSSGWLDSPCSIKIDLCTKQASEMENCVLW